MDWTEILVSVNDRALEAVANFLWESGAGGAVLTDCEDGTVAIAAYFPAGDSHQLLAKLNEYFENLEEMGIEVDARVSSKVIVEQDWTEEWKKYYRPVEIGNVCISPSWLVSQVPSDKVLVQLDPGLAFGTGSHATTRMCVGELALRAKGKSVLDLGTGSGILAIVAAKSGASSVDAVDNDPQVLKIAAENARVNQCTIKGILGDALVEFSKSKHDLVVANIGYDACTSLAEIFRQGKNCALILSGFPEERLDEFLAQFSDLVWETRCLEGWACVTLEAE